MLRTRSSWVWKLETRSHLQTLAAHRSPLPLAGEVAVSAAGEGLLRQRRIDRFRFGCSNMHSPLTRAYSPTSPLKRGEVTVVGGASFFRTPSWWLFLPPLRASDGRGELLMASRPEQDATSIARRCSR